MSELKRWNFITLMVSTLLMSLSLAVLSGHWAIIAAVIGVILTLWSIGLYGGLPCLMQSPNKMVLFFVHAIGLWLVLGGIGLILAERDWWLGGINVFWGVNVLFGVTQE
ncbi:hypothetical protein C7B61_07755 [filamentous cyanobacterium CCP1]|nr:hypothetical protein C7B76_21490 [filamentous cyanobacterium CCP2]PSB67134.1 hypothetical protein C7B61_07755 [filamentous cyanobacterium CCP1]